MKRNIKITEDGSSTLFVPELNEHYHSIFGAVQEAQHVFIDMGLKAIEKQNVKIFEMGFGTGLNCLLTKLHAPDKQIDYCCIEKYPIEKKFWEQLNFCDVLGLNNEQVCFFQNIHETMFNRSVFVDKHFNLHKIQADMTSFIHQELYDLVYYDAFAPEVQPALWTRDIFDDIYQSMNTGGIITTYCAKGEVRRMMQDVGFKVERLPGPPGKREMLRGIRN